MVNLEELVFKVNTQELDAASKKLDVLANSLAAVGKATKAAGKSGGDGGGMEKPLEKVTTAAKAAEKSLERVALQAQYVQQGFSKIDAGRIAGVAQKFGEGSAQVQQMIANLKIMSSSVTTVTTEVDKQTKAVGNLRAGYMSVEERQKSITDFMTQGFSRGQASILTTAKNLGAVGDELARIGNELQTQRKLQGGDPFDKSVSGLLALKNRYTELREANRQYIKDTQLTRDQTRELARDKERLIIKLQQEGAGFQDIRSAIRQHNADFIEAASRVNGLTKVEADLERQTRETANSVRALAREEEKVDSIVNSLTGSTDTHTKTSQRAAESIARYERNLRLAGVSGEQAALKLELYRKKIAQIQVIEENRKSQLLSNALAPQISDVVVSLGSGQNPLTVLLQQGLQVRDLIGLSGVAAEDLKKTFASAASSMVASLAMTGKAIGSLLIGSIQSAGAAVIKFGSDITGTTLILGKLREQLDKFPKAMTGITGLTSVFKLAAGAAALLAGTVVVGAIALLISLAVAIFKVTKEENELNRALNLQNAAFGASTATLGNYTKGLEAAGYATGDIRKVVVEMAKAGNLSVTSLEQVASTAITLQKVSGVAIDETVKKFSELSKKPSEALAEFAKSSGLVKVSLLETVFQLENAGRKSEAAALAITAYGDASKTAAERVKENYGFLTRLGISIADIWSKTWDAILGVGRKVEGAERIREIQAKLETALKGDVRPGGARAKVIENLQAELAGLQKIQSIEGRRVYLNQQQAKDAEAATSWNERQLSLKTNQQKREEEITKIRKEGQRLNKSELEISKQIAAVNEKYKDKTTPKTDAQKEAIRLTKEYEKALNGLRKDIIDSEASQFNLNEATKEYLRIVTDESWAKFDSGRQQEIKDQYILAYQREELAKKLKEETELREAISKHAIKWAEESQAAYAKGVEDLTASNKALREEIELIGLSADAQRAVLVAREQEIIAKKELEVINLKNIGFYEKEIELLEQEIALRKEGINLRALKFEKEEYTRLQTSLTDAIVTGLFEGGKAGSKKLRDIIVAELRKPITVFIQAAIGNITGSIFGGKSSGGISAPGEAAGGLGSLSSIKGAYDMVSGGLNVAGSAGQLLAKNLTNISSLGSTALTQVAGEFAGGLMSTASSSSFSSALSGTGAQMAGALVGSVMNGFSGYGISKALSGGYSTGGNTVNTLAAIASMIPGIGPIAGVVGGLVNRAFGRKAPVTTGQDLRGNFSTTGADVAQYQTNFSKGGWFRSNKTTVTRSEISSELDKYLDDSLRAITATTKNFAMVLGLIPDAIDGVSQSINIALLGLNSEQQQSAIANALTGFGSKLAEQLLGTYSTSTVLTGRKMVYQPWGESNFGEEGRHGRYNKSGDRMGSIGFEDVYTTITTWIAGPFVKAGETAGAALERLATSLISVNTVFDTLNQTMLTSTLTGGDAASKLLDVFGGIEKFSAVTTSYYDNFYSEQEKVATTTRQLTAIFGNMGLTLPKTRDEYRALIESQNLYTDSGRATYAALMNLSPAFASITAAVEQFTSALIDEVRRLRGEASTASGNGLAYYESQFAMATGAARAGDASALERLPELSQAVEEAAKLQATSTADFIRIQSWLIASLSQTSSLAGTAVPAFANGGMHSGGARIVGENGPELEITGASRIFNANQTASMLGGGSLEEILMRLNDNITGLRSEVRADVGHNAKTAKLLDRVIPNGESIAISGVDGGVL